MNEPGRYVVKKRDPSKPREPNKTDRAQKGMDKLTAQIPGIAGFLLIAAGLYVMLAFRNSSIGSTTIKAGGALVGLGIASLGYWAFANKNDNYNF